MTPLIISADDYAQSAAIDAGILELIERGRLSATSCLTLSPRWQQAAGRISRDIQNRADIGLHLDFTQFGEVRYPLPVLIARAISRRLPMHIVRESIDTQLCRFEDALGRAPDYIDGHQHVHQLPQIRQALMEAIARHYSATLPWLRIANPPVQDGFKGWIIRNLGAKNLRTAARKSGLPCSGTLLGVYAFDGDPASYLQKLGKWFAAAKTRGGGSVLMCHPARAQSQGAGTTEDPIYQARLREFEVFSSSDFLELLKQHDISIARGNTLIN